jgi:preprotein translocase SecE subunit
VWPTRKSLINNCVVAVVMMAVCGVVIGAFDYIAHAFMFNLLIETVGKLFA